MSQYSQRQWQVLVALCLLSFCNFLGISQYPPFFIKEAVNKGATPIQYGSVLGIFHLAKLFGCILCGKYFHHTGPKLLLILGAFSSSVTFILAGFLSHVPGTSTFIGLASAIKAVEGLGDAAGRTMSFTIITNEFPEQVGSVVGIMTTSVGLGALVGPLVGGLLHQLGGFTLPFVTMGCLLLVSTVITAKVLPEEQNCIETLSSNQNIISLLKVSSTSLFMYTIIAAGFAHGLLMVILEPHLHNFHLSPTALGAVFVLFGAMVDIASPVWGLLCDRVISPTIATVVGGLLVSTAFLVFGPAPYIPLDNTIVGCCIAMVIFGIGFSGEFVGSFCGMLRGAAEAGLPTDMVTSGHVSSLFLSSISIGMLLGSGTGGIFLTALGFKWASVVVMGFHLLVVAVGGIHICSRCQLGTSSRAYSLNADGREKLIASSGLEKSYGSIDGQPKVGNHEQISKNPFYMSPYSLNADGGEKLITISELAKSSGSIDGQPKVGHHGQISKNPFFMSPYSLNADGGEKLIASSELAKSSGSIDGQPKVGNHGQIPKNPFYMSPYSLNADGGEKLIASSELTKSSASIDGQPKVGNHGQISKNPFYMSPYSLNADEGEKLVASSELAKSSGSIDGQPKVGNHGRISKNPFYKSP